MVTGRLTVVVALSPLESSVLVAVTVRAKPASLLAGGVMLRDGRVQPETSTAVVPKVAVKLCVPSLSVAPTGMAPICTVRVSEPSVSVRAGLTVSAIAVSSLPEAGATASAGASATAVTVTGRLAVVVAVSPLEISVLVAVTVSVKSASLSDGGVTASDGKVQPETSTAVLPRVAVKLWVPSVSVAPTGMAPICTVRLSDPSASTSAGLTVSAIAVSSLPPAGVTARAGASATAVTVTARLAVVVALSPLENSVLVAVTVRAKSASLWAGGVIASADSVQPETSTAVLPVVAVKLWLPSPSVAPTGMAPICTASVSEPSASTRAGLIESAIAASSFPPAGATASVGASATAVTVTGRLAVVVATSPLEASVLLAVTVSAKSASLLAGGVMPSAERVQLETSAAVLPAVAVKLCVPSLSVAPTGMAPICSDRVSEPSVSTRPGMTDSAIAVSSLPTAGATASVGASATAVTVTGRLMVVVAVSLLEASVLVAVTVRAKSPSLLAGGVTLRDGRVQPETSTPVLPKVAVKLCVPSLSVAPTGMAPIRTVRVSEPSVSVRAGLTVSAIAVSSLPEAGATASVGASATAVTVTGRLMVVVALSLLEASVLVAVTVRAKSTSLLAGGVMLRDGRVQPETSTAVLPNVAVKLCVPSLSVAPTGMAAICTVKVSEPSVSVRDGLTVSAIAVSSLPVASATASAGASATAVTVTGRLAIVVALSPLEISVLVAVTVSVKSASLLAGGVTVRDDRVQPETSTAVLPTVAVKLWVPSVKVAPTGMALIFVVRLSEPSVSTSAELTDSAMAVSSLPVAGATATAGASATAMTVRLTVAVSVPPCPSLTV